MGVLLFELTDFFQLTLFVTLQKNYDLILWQLTGICGSVLIQSYTIAQKIQCFQYTDTFIFYRLYCVVGSFLHIHSTLNNPYWQSENMPKNVWILSEATISDLELDENQMITKGIKVPAGNRNVCLKFRDIPAKSMDRNTQ